MTTEGAEVPQQATDSARPPVDRDLGARGGRSALLGVGGQVGKLAINMLSLVVLARLISPEDYGLIAMVVAVVGVAELVKDMGLFNAAVRASSLSRQQRDNLWWVNTGLGLGAALAVCALAPVLSWFYGEQRLVNLTLVLSVMFLLGGMSTQYAADITRKLQFGRQALVNISAGGLAFGSALWAASAGWGYWALALQQVLGSSLTFAFLFMAVRWIPRRYRRGVPMKEFFTFGLPVFGSQVLTYYGANLDQMLVGRFFGNVALGQYTRGIQIVRMPLNQVRSPVSQVALSTLSKAREDGEAYSRLLSKAQLGLLYPVAIASTGLATVASDLVPVLLGPGWALVATFVVIFALGDMVNSLASAAGWLYESEGKSGALLRYTIFYTAVRIAMFALAVPFGVHAVASVYVVAALLLWPVSLWYCSRSTGRSTTALFWGSFRVFVVTGSSFAVGFFASHALAQPGGIRFLLALVGYLLTLAAWLFLPQIRADLVTISTMVKSSVRRPAAARPE